MAGWTKPPLKKCICSAVLCTFKFFQEEFLPHNQILGQLPLHYTCQAYPSQYLYIDGRAHGRTAIIICRSTCLFSDLHLLYQRIPLSRKIAPIMFFCFIHARILIFFRAGEVFVKLGHFDKHFLKNSRSKRPAVENFGVFSPRCS